MIDSMISGYLIYSDELCMRADGLYYTVFYLMSADIRLKQA